MHRANHLTLTPPVQPRRYQAAGLGALEVPMFFVALVLALSAHPKPVTHAAPVAYQPLTCVATAHKGLLHCSAR